MTTLTVKVEHKWDEDPELSWLGELYLYPVSKWQFRVPRHKLSYHMQRDLRGDYAYYLPDDSRMLEETRKWYTKHGYSKHEAYTLAMSHAREDMKRLLSYGDDWWCIGIVCTAYVDGIEVGYASCWGFESDGGDYLKEAEQELIDEAVADARETLAKLQAATIDTIEIIRKD